MIPTEDNYVEWTLRGMAEYFGRRGYSIRTYSIGQPKEFHFPIDRLIVVGNKIIGLQFKRPLREKKPLTFRTKARQHSGLAKSHWSFYCLPDFTDWNLQNVALYHVRFARPGKTRAINEIRFSYRWGTFVGRIIACTKGLILKDESELASVMSEIDKDPQDAYIVLNKRKKEVVLLSKLPTVG